jgi:hypothetical protein
MAVNPQIKTLSLRAPKAPNLPIAPVQYAQQYVDQLTNALRLYFAQVDNFAQPLADATGGALIKFPNGAFHQDGYTTLTAAMTNVSTTPIQVTSTAGFLDAGALYIGNELIKYTGKTATTFTGITRGAYSSTNVAHSIGDYIAEAQPVPSSTTALTVAFTATDVSNQVYIDPLDITKVVHNVAGYYNIQFSIQMLTEDGDDNVTLWFRQNGTDVPYSAGIATVPGTHGGNPGTAIISWNIVLPLDAGDYIQLMMASNTGNTVATTYPPGTSPVHPASPSIILTSTFVSALY